MWPAAVDEYHWWTNSGWHASIQLAPKYMSAWDEYMILNSNWEWNHPPSVGTIMGLEQVTWAIPYIDVMLQGTLWVQENWVDKVEWNFVGSVSISAGKQHLNCCRIHKTRWPWGDFPIGKAWLKAILELGCDIAALLSWLLSFVLLNELHSICTYVSTKASIFWSPTEAIKCTWTPKFGDFT